MTYTVQEHQFSQKIRKGNQWVLHMTTLTKLKTNVQIITTDKAILITEGITLCAVNSLLYLKARSLSEVSFLKISDIFRW
jgi:hypothetical protein